MTSDTPRKAPGRWGVVRAVAVSVLVALTVFVLTAAAQAGAAQAGAASGPTPESTSDDPDLMWSVRPTPTDDADHRPNFQYEMEAGSMVRDSFRVRNYGTGELTLAVYASDAIVTEEGSLDLLPASEAPTDVGTWIRLEVDELSIPAGKYVDVPFSMAVPAKAESGDHSGGIVTSLVTRSPGNSDKPVILDRRLGSRLQVRVSGDLDPSLKIEKLDVGYHGTANPFGRGELEVSYRVTNDGNVRLAADPLVEVRGPAGALSQTAVLDRTSELLPGSSLAYKVRIPAIWPSVRPTVTLKLTPIATRSGDEFPDDLVFTASQSVAAVPVTFLSGLAVAVAGPLLWWRRRLKVRDNVDAKVRAAVEAALAAQETKDNSALAAPTAQLGTPDP